MTVAFCQLPPGGVVGQVGAHVKQCMNLVTETKSERRAKVISNKRDIPVCVPNPSAPGSPAPGEPEISTELAVIGRAPIFDRVVAQGAGQQSPACGPVGWK